MKKNDEVKFEAHWLDERIRERAEVFSNSPSLIYPWWRQPCKVKVLILTDGFLDFSSGDFGLSTFVEMMVRDGRNYVKFEITLGHRSGGNMGNPIAGISERIQNFQFTNPSHFSNTKYDQVWLFGAETSNDILPQEIALLSSFMNDGGGVFATGDHGSLGKGLCGAIPRVRSMRLWESTGGRVGMDDAMRNDTNRNGHDAQSFFDDQSDDVPQTIQPKLYMSNLNELWQETYPHPLLCSPQGMIKVLPDHPHEGECVEPTDFSRKCPDGTDEYPLGIEPELIAYSTVPANNRAGTKAATVYHSFGAICAYDGYRANVGRVVTDATWHHFVNINLIGELDEVSRDINAGQNPSNEDDSKDREAVGPSTHGFLFSPSGRAHLNAIKNYYVNIGVWISRQSQQQCFNSVLIWQLKYQHRVMEATVADPSIPLKKIPIQLLYAIGTHATDVLGKKAGQCRKLQILIDIVRPILPELEIWIDPWLPKPPKFDPIPPIPPIPWFDLEPILHIAVGAGIAAMNEEFGQELHKRNEKFEKKAMEVFLTGAKYGMQLASKSFQAQMDSISKLF